MSNLSRPTQYGVKACSLLTKQFQERCLITAAMQNNSTNMKEESWESVFQEQKQF